MRWQEHEAKQSFSEVLRAAQESGPQIVTRHGQDIAAVIAMDDYRRLTGEVVDFREFLRSGQGFEGLDLTRSKDLPRDIDLAL